MNFDAITNFGQKVTADAFENIDQEILRIHQPRIDAEARRLAAISERKMDYKFYEIF